MSPSWETAIWAVWALALQATAQLSMEPFLWDLLASTAAVLVFSYCTPRPPQLLVARFFP